MVGGCEGGSEAAEIEGGMKGAFPGAGGGIPGAQGWGAVTAVSPGSGCLCHRPSQGHFPPCPWPGIRWEGTWRSPGEMSQLRDGLR